MSLNKIIAVFGATGNQGSSVVRAICAKPESGFIARVVARDPTSDKVKALTSLGATAVKCDAFNQEEVVSALQGCYGAYFVTWTKDPDQEVAHIRTYADAAKTAGLQHAVFSTCEDTKGYLSLESDIIPTIYGRFKVPHFETKGGSEHFFTDNNVPVTFLNTVFYYENLIGWLPPRRGDDGVYRFGIPIGQSKMVSSSTQDIGRCTLGILEGGPEKYANGQHIPACGDHISVQDIADAFAEVFPGVKFDGNTTATPDDFRAMGFPGCEAVANMFLFVSHFSDKGLNEKHSIAKSREVNPQLLSFKDWLAQNKMAFGFIQ